MRRQLIELINVSSTNHRFVGLERGDEARYDVSNVDLALNRTKPVVEKVTSSRPQAARNQAS